ncbi:SH3 domain-containing protein [Colletotrichum graminicola]|uniref:SH3 domain-containing protein n=1 Tax=Colletotrichum graminicola (strain M1.001 / M2 / FGSC 10212) TaxID=645133 RepID=E3QI92_COLGM|nr:SH3 domain-containing protein [Colletotrichum graminicola M1.001]EFQ30707.1 SH3 domain-containing protein [Colletotrichum graminicola M1.001]WDK21454.1 SH3 domain-containing protein [Colletotrichum graminicola]
MSTAPFRVKALFEYSSPHEDDLQFPAGAVITVTDEEDADWYSGEYLDDAGVKHEGIFPRNFVEKIEPQAPPRPTRTRPKKEAEVTSPASEAPPIPQLDPQPAQEAHYEAEHPEPPAPAALPTSPDAAAELEPEPVKAPEPVPEPVPAPPANKATEPPAVTSPPIAKASSTPAKPGPPPKPSSNAFKDRIAAFNKASAAPIAPFKPTGLAQGSYHIKKPFVAPPPSRNAYVPPPSQVPVAKVYRRDEDPEILEREAENQESAEKAGTVPGSTGEEGEDAPKPTSLKERIALLQRQQQEQAQRHAEAAAKKEKAKRPPPKKRTDSQEASEDAGAAAPVPVSAPEADTDDAAGRSSVDSPRLPPAPRRKSSRGPAAETYHDGNEADMSGAGDTEGPEDLTERDDSDAAPRPVPRPRVASPVGASKEDERAAEEAEEEEEDDDIDPEVRRREEIRARMAKMSGGMGMHGMFGIPMGAPAIPKKKKTADRPVETSAREEREEEMTSPVGRVPVPGMMALPGMGVPRRQEEPAAADEPVPPTSPRAPPPPPRTVEENNVDDEPVAAPPPSLPTREPSGAPPVPGSRPAPPPVPAESRPPPVPPVSGIKSPSEGSESDDELSGGAQDIPKAEEGRAPPPLPPVATSARSPPPIPGSEFSPSSPTSSTNKRMSRMPPPIPGAAPPIPTSQSRPPPPPPPGGTLSRQSTQDMHMASPMSPPIRPAPQGEDEDEVTEYEGDYDTDIASSVPHKDALKSHARDSSLDDTTSVMSPVSDAPPTLPPPIPTGPPPRAAPPPVPMQPPPSEKRRSMDVPRAAPPPPPPAKDDDEYDPYNYASSKVPYSQRASKIEEEEYFEQDTAPLPSPPQSRVPPPAPPGGRARQSMDLSRASMSQRRSMDVHRPSTSAESGFIANDVDLAKQSGWWRQDKTVPPVFQGRRDLYYETVDLTSGSQVTRTIYVLFQDYSQTVITVEYDQNNAADVMLDQRHDPPPRALRQDELEQSYERFGRPIFEAVASKKETIVGDGTPQGLIHELLKPFNDALAPIGTRAYGALVYSNMANASTQQNDQIRPGDIISIRNARFQGKHGPMHAKYSMEVGKPDHVAVVSEWDGTKKKVRAWEQGRESKKVKVESFKLDDLRSGEVKIWRVMPRSWVGWTSPS